MDVNGRKGITAGSSIRDWSRVERWDSVCVGLDAPRPTYGERERMRGGEGETCCLWTENKGGSRLLFLVRMVAFGVRFCVVVKLVKA